MTPVALLAGVGCGLGIVFVILGLRETAPSLKRPGTKNGRGDQRGMQRVAVAVGAGLVVLVVTGWPVGGLLAAAVVGSWHTLFGQKASAAAEVTRIEAIAAWTEEVEKRFSPELRALPINTVPMRQR